MDKKKKQLDKKPGMKVKKSKSSANKSNQQRSVPYTRGIKGDPPVSKPDRTTGGKRVQTEYYYQNAMLVYGLLPYLPVREREIVKKWMTRMNCLSGSEDERSTRNDYMWFLLTQLQSGIVTIPFMREPPNEILPLNDVVDKELYRDVLAAADKAIKHIDEKTKEMDQGAKLMSSSSSSVTSQKRGKPKSKEKSTSSESLKREPNPKIKFVPYG